jgi:hypothetical protein
MKSSMIAAVLLTASVSVQAQTSSTTIATPAAQSSTTIQAQQPAAAKKWGVVAVSENAIGQADIDAKASDAAVYSQNQLGVNYKLNDVFTAEVRHLFNMANDPAQLTGAAAATNGNRRLKTVATAAILKMKTAQTMAGSDALTYAFRADLPIGEYFQEIKRLGNLRMDVTPVWHAGSKVDLSLAISPRILFNEATAANADTFTRLVLAPAASYNFSDKLSAYYAFTADMRTADLNRAKLETVSSAAATHEIGASVAVGVVTINPALTSDFDMLDKSADQDVRRSFSHETNSYNLNLSAVF